MAPNYHLASGGRTALYERIKDSEIATTFGPVSLRWHRQPLKSFLSSFSLSSLFLTFAITQAVPNNHIS